MHASLPFLEYLGLGGDADASAIRRAYARELKLIDQATQATKFQQLREAYDAALAWSLGPAEPPDAFVDDTAPALAQQVFDDFLRCCSPLRQAPHVNDPSSWDALIRRHLADDRLTNLTASLGFEVHIAAYLVSSWEPGNESLFLAAVNVFDWETDARRLPQLGEAGLVIAHAIEQFYLFHRQEATALVAAQNILVGLRLKRPPMRMRLREEMPQLESMLQYFPAYIAITAGMRNVERWRALYGELEPSAGAPAPLPLVFGPQQAPFPSSAPTEKDTSTPVLLILLLVGLVRVFSWFF